MKYLLAMSTYCLSFVALAVFIYVNVNDSTMIITSILTVNALSALYIWRKLTKTLDLFENNLH